jgi:GNAT superfamily N-acetyltransferase
MSPLVRLRPALAEDSVAMVAVLNNAFQDSPFHNRCFPPSDPGSQQELVNYVQKNLADPTSHIVVADVISTGTASGEPSIAGWARWVRRPLPAPDAKPAPPLVFTEEVYPAGGDPAFAARFFQANYDAMTRATKGQPVWSLSMMVVSKVHQRRGVASELMRFGVDKADREGWAAYVNASPEGKDLYERFGFRTVQRSDFGGGIVSDHMKREAKRSSS